jgi:Tol biopolymer transport system component
MRIAVLLSVATVFAVLLALPLSAGVTAAPGPRGTIAVTGGSLHSQRQIALISPASRSTRRVTAPDDIVRLDVSPDGTRIVVAGFKGIWVMRRDSSGSRRILDQRQSFGAGEIAWAPDGGELVFAGSEDSLFTISADGKGRKRITGHADQPDWSPDGKQIVFVQNPDQSSRAGILAAIASDGAGLRRIVDRGRWYGPRVSPDGSTLVFDNRKSIFLASMKGGKARLFIRNGFFPAWSPDGRYLAFARAVRCSEVCTSRVFVIRASGGKARPYGPRIGDIGPLSWSR